MPHAQKRTSPRRALFAFLATLALVAGLLGIAGCGGGDAADIQGEWQRQDSKVTYVFTGSEMKMVGLTFNYTVDAGKKEITFENAGATGTAKYKLDAEKKVLTLEEDDGNGGTKTTVFDKVSDDTSAEPKAGK